MSKENKILNDEELKQVTGGGKNSHAMVAVEPGYYRYAGHYIHVSNCYLGSGTKPIPVAQYTLGADGYLHMDCEYNLPIMNFLDMEQVALEAVPPIYVLPEITMERIF